MHHLLYLMFAFRVRMKRWGIAGGEEVDLESNYVIVDKSTIKCEETHQCDHISELRDEFKRTLRYLLIIKD